MQPKHWHHFKVIPAPPGRLPPPSASSCSHACFLMRVLSLVRCLASNRRLVALNRAPGLAMLRHRVAIFFHCECVASPPSHPNFPTVPNRFAMSPRMPLEPVAFGGLSFSRKRDPEISSKLFAFCVQFRYLFVGEHAVRPPFVLPCLGPVGLDRGAGFLLGSGSLGLARSAGATSKAGIARTRGITRLPAPDWIARCPYRVRVRKGGCRSDLESVFLCNASTAVREPGGRSREQDRAGVFGRARR